MPDSGASTRPDIGASTEWSFEMPAEVDRNVSEHRTVSFSMNETVPTGHVAAWKISPFVALH